MTTPTYRNDQLRRLPWKVAKRYYRGGVLQAHTRHESGHTSNINNRDQDAIDVSAPASGEGRAHVNYEPPPPNDEPERRRIRRFRYISKFVRFIRGLFERVKPRKLTAEEIRLAEKKKERERIRMLRLSEIARCRQIIRQRLIDLGFYSQDEKSRTKHGPEFSIGRANDNEIILRCTKFPAGPGNTITRLADDDICTALSESIGHPVTAKYERGLEHIGLRYFVAIAGSDGLPPVYTITEMLKDYPSTAAPLALPFGVRTNGIPLVVDLAGMPHLLGGGTTGKGKSNLVHAIICTLINRNTPEVVNLDLLDFKDQALEMSPYEGIPHLRLGHIIKESGEMKTYFGGLQDEMRRRYKELERRKKRKISDYNRRIPKGEKRMPYLVVIIDEFASCVHELGQDDAERAVRKVAEQGRAVGIHLIVFTQYPKADIISSVTTSNMPGRVSFYMPKSEQSRVILESDAAHTQLGNDQLGRAIMLHNGKEHLVQTPLVTDRQISHFIAAARSGTAVDDIGLPIDPEEILRWSLTVNFNRLGFREIKQSFADREISDADMLSLLRSMDDQEYDIDGTLYVVRNIGGSVGRRVELLDQEEKSAPKGGDAQEMQNTQHKTQNHTALRADLRRVLDTHEAKIQGEKFRGKGINMDIDSDLFTLEPAENGREWALLNDVKIICQAHNVKADEILKIMEE